MIIVVKYTNCVGIVLKILVCMSFANTNAELKYRLQRLEAQRSAAEANEATQQIKKNVDFTTAENAAQMEQAVEETTPKRRAAFQPHESTMMMSSVATDVLAPQRAGSNFSNFFTASKASSKTATSSSMYNVISKNLQAVLGSINEWINNRSVDPNAYKMDNHTTENYTMPIADSYEVSELFQAPAVTNKSDTQYCVTEFDQKTTPNLQATESSYAVTLNPLPNLNKRQCVDGVSNCKNIANQYMVHALAGSKASSTACTCTVDLSSDTSDEDKVCSGGCRTQCVPEISQLMYNVEKEDIDTNKITKTTTDNAHLSPYYVKANVLNIMDKPTNACNEKYCEAFAGKKIGIHNTFAERLSRIDELDELHSVQ